MQPLGTVVAFGAGPIGALARLDATALACDLLEADFRRLKQAEAGSLLLVLLADAGNPALAAATKAIRILRMRGGGEAVVVVPPVPADPGPLATQRIERAAELTGACVLQPIDTGWADAVRCLVEPLAIFGLVGVEPREIRSLLRPRVALLHASPARVLSGARDVLLTCRLRPDATLRDVDEAARQARELAPSARLVIAGPEVSADEGARVLAASFL